MEATLVVKPVNTPAQSDQAIVTGGVLLRIAFACGDRYYLAPEWDQARAVLMESAKFEARLNSRPVNVEYDIAYSLAFDKACE
jgi:hypothetical protein